MPNDACFTPINWVGISSGAVCRMFGAKPWSELMLTLYLFDLFNLSEKWRKLHNDIPW